jgi:hypothetical protein
MSTTSYLWATSSPLALMNNVTAANHQVDPAIAANLDGTAFLGAWGTWPGVNPIGFRYMDASGAPITSEVNTYLNSEDASIAPLQGGGFIVTCTNHAVDPNGDIRAAIVSAQGIGKVFFPIDATANVDRESDVALLSDGGFVVTWTRDFGAGDNDIVGQVFNANGSMRGGHFTGDSNNSLSTTHSAVAGLAGGGFVTVWEQSQVGSANTQAVFERYDAWGNALGNHVVFDSLGNTNKDIQVAALADGGFVVAYADSGWGNGTDITARVFNADGTARTDFLHVNDASNGGLTAGDQYLPSLTIMSNGGFAVGWRDDSAHEYVQAYDTNGNALGTNNNLEAHINEGEIAGLSGGRLAMVANSYLSDGSGGSIRSETFELARIVTGDDTNEVIQSVSDGLHEVIDGKGGDDTVVFSKDLASYQLTDLGSKIVVSGADGLHTLSNVEHLQFSDGTIDVNDGNPLFDTVYYMSHNLDVFHAHANALAHFNASGWHEGRDPNAFFSVNGYLATNPDVKALGMNPLDHYDQIGWHQGRDPGANFDTTLYLTHNPDVAAAGIDPLQHYLQSGMAEGRQTYQAIGTAVNGFDAEYYLLHNADVAAANVDPYQHYLTAGWHEGRNPNAWFDTNGYLAHYQDVAAANINPLQHYEQTGWAEGRDPSAGFDTLGYLAANPDVAAAHVNPLDHFINTGIYEGRVAISDGVFH